MIRLSVKRAFKGKEQKPQTLINQQTNQPHSVPLRAILNHGTGKYSPHLRQNITAV